MATTYLDDLLAGAHRRVAAARGREPLDALRERAADRPAPPAFAAVLAAAGVQVIAEIKRASPSKGPIAPELVAPDRARAYADGGAAAVSVLTEPERFGGNLADLADVAALGIPTLRKDFVVDPYQVWEARLSGASAVLLIVAALDEATIVALQEEAVAAELETLVEVHDAAEVAVATRVGARVVGINARDLRTFALDPDGFGRLRPRLADGVVAVSESGIGRPQDVRRAATEGADAVLVGEHLVRAADPAAAVADLVAAGASGARASAAAAPASRASAAAAPASRAPAAGGSSTAGADPIPPLT